MLLANNFIFTWFNALLNSNAYNPKTAPVDRRDIGMVARFDKPSTPFDGWGMIVLDTVNKHQKAHDAFKITEDGYTYYEERIASDMQACFKSRTGLIVDIVAIKQMEIVASKCSDYYSQIAKQCLEFEKMHAPLDKRGNVIRIDKT